ncbi:4F2 cell-surface antigen heavy chain-like [Electrophorus electricus]|uniref:Glycosyl hydrolase family 13 catalytic domain-containing protein n=1 Tax=Electrophorus electricus TaxID=8005 RepID=A0A4W4DPN2_ELEEL|nr:4F2 cell-surface antigen heavy chain-like [Electrophorus electricus]
MSKGTEPKEVELNELDQEKQPMTAETPTDSEKNGCVKVKVAEDAEVKFTGLSKEELMRVAGTTGWVRIRWILLVLFWLGWVGMLAGAVVIIVQAPRCKPIPDMQWWNEGPLYKISDLNAFSGDKGIKGVEEKLDSLNQLKVKGLILGPIHSVQVDQLATLDLKTINPEVGEEKDLDSLLERAHKKGISIVLDLTPNYNRTLAWFSNAAAVAEKLRDACAYWRHKGVDGFLLSDLHQIASVHTWQSIRDVVQANTTEGTKKTALIGSVTSLPVDAVSQLLNKSEVDLLLIGLPSLVHSGVDHALAVNQLYSSHPQTSLGWSLTPLISTFEAMPIRLHHMLLFTLPGTPVFTTGVEVGLKKGESLHVIWDLENLADENNKTAKIVRAERGEVRGFFKTLSDLRGKERALLHGDYIPLHSATFSFAFLRLWDQSERFITALNWGDVPVTMMFSNNDLPAEARVRLSTDAEKIAVDNMVLLDKLELEPKQAILLSYPYAG